MTTRMPVGPPTRSRLKAGAAFMMRVVGLSCRTLAK